MPFDIYPAIDLQGGRAVRLQQGEAASAEIFCDNPIDLAKSFAAAGARWVHIVNLDGAFTGGLTNYFKFVAAVKKETSLKVQYGGGIREQSALDGAMAAGADRVLLTTIAVREPAFVENAARKYPGRVAVAVDCFENHILTDGWTQNHPVSPTRFAQQMEKLGACALIVTDKARDGMGRGINIPLVREIAYAMNDIPVFASGGIGTLDHIAKVALLADDNVEGLVLGRAMYKGCVTLKDALKYTAA